VIRAATAVLATAALGACASDRVTLLDNEAGHPDGAVAVISANGGETLVDRPNTQATLGSGATRTRAVDPNKPKYTALLDTLPPAATRFRITFPVNDARILGGQRAVIEQIRTELARRPGAQIEVAGFTDSTGDDRSNDVLSRERAEAVARELREAGFEIDAGDAVGRGEDEAKARLGDNVSDESFRRVDVIVR
jgi:outer membrane protein OmpA-like peptidoglycan-associated protein